SRHWPDWREAEYVTCCAAVRRECLRRRQLAFIGPPASVPTSCQQQRPLVSPPGMSPFWCCGAASFALRDWEPHGWVGNSSCMDKVTTLWERAQFCEECAATAIDPEAREQWQK